jgi:hypothetical protein
MLLGAIGKTRMKVDKSIAVWVLCAWVVMFCIGLWYHWDFANAPIGELSYWGAKIIAYIFTFLLVGETLNQ